MNPEETMVEEQIDDVAADDALPEDVVEEQAEPEQSLESVMTDNEESEEEETDKGERGTSEPGWIRKRIDKAVSKAVEKTRAEMLAEFNAQMAPLRAKMLEDEAKELVRTGAVKDLEVAKELLSYRQGRNPEPTKADGSAKDSVPPRNERGQFKSNDDAATLARIDMLKHQATKIKNSTGLDVIAEYNSNKAIKDAIIAGEMDFYDVAEEMKNRKPGRKPPSPMRSPNGANAVNPNAIDSMSDEQFDRMERNIKEKGARYSLR